MSERYVSWGACQTPANDPDLFLFYVSPAVCCAPLPQDPGEFPLSSPLETTYCKTIIAVPRQRKTAGTRSSDTTTRSTRTKPGNRPYPDAVIFIYHRTCSREYYYRRCRYTCCYHRTSSSVYPLLRTTTPVYNLLTPQDMLQRTAYTHTAKDRYSSSSRTLHDPVPTSTHAFCFFLADTFL